MNQFQRKYLDLLKQTDYISAVARPGRQIVNIDYFVYTARVGSDAVPIPVLGTGRANVQMQADSDFVMTYISSASSTATGVINTTAAATVQLTDTGSGKTYFSAPTVLQAIGGYGGFPFLLPSPRVLNPNTILQIDIANLSSTITLPGVFFAFHGARIFYAD